MKTMNNFDIFLLIAVFSSAFGVDIVEVPFQPRVKGKKHDSSFSITQTCPCNICSNFSRL